MRTLIRYEGMRALREHLSPVEAEKFIVLIRREPFDYTEWQQTLWQDKSVDELSTEAQLNRYLREESPRLLSLSKQEDFGDFSKFKISENLCFRTYLKPLNNKAVNSIQ